MIANCIIVSSNFSPLPLSPHSSIQKSSKVPIFLLIDSIRHPRSSKIRPYFIAQRKGQLQICRSSLHTQTPEDPTLTSSSNENELLAGGGDGNDDGGGERDWTTSFLLFSLWAGLMYYVFFLAPNQTPTTDMYFLKKLLNLKGDDGFQMNGVLVALWYVMGLWPLVYSMLLFPTARSSKSKIPIWPFAVLSFAGGAYALIPYFVLWRPPAPPVEDSELDKWPLNFLESKVTAGMTLAAGLALLVYSLTSGADAWKEFSQYFQGSKFIHVMSIDFALCSTFAPFWVYNDMTARNWDNKVSWLLPLSLVPFLGPAVYLLLRPSLPKAAAMSVPVPQISPDEM